MKTVKLRRVFWVDRKGYLRHGLTVDSPAESETVSIQVDTKPDFSVFIHEFKQTVQPFGTVNNLQADMMTTECNQQPIDSASFRRKQRRKLKGKS